MPSALEREAVTDAALLTGPHSGLRALVHEFDHFTPRPGLTSKKLRITEEVETAFGSRQGNADAVFVGQEPD